MSDLTFLAWLMVGGLLVVAVWTAGLRHFIVKTKKDPGLSTFDRNVRYAFVALIIAAWLFSIWEKTSG
jgi:hypothetical protein